MTCKTKVKVRHVFISNWPSDNTLPHFEAPVLSVRYISSVLLVH